MELVQVWMFVHVIQGIQVQHVIFQIATMLQIVLGMVCVLVQTLVDAMQVIQEQIAAFQIVLG